MLPAADRVAAIIPAAGSGTRLGAGQPKAFLELDGLTLLTRAALAMSQFAGIVMVAAPPDEVQQAGHLLGEVDADVIVVPGGRDRQDSVAACLAALPEHVEWVLVHDAARPLVPEDLVRRVLEALVAGAPAVIPVLPVVDTIRVVSDDEVGHVVDRTTLRRVQTPQGFQTAVLRDAYRRASGSPATTDDAALVQEAGVSITAVLGDERALKITTPDDVVIARAYIEEQR